jgi:DNA-binding transcriptional MerR regulator
MADAGDPRDDGRRQGKSAAAFRTISEVAEELDVPPHVLRFWEGKFTQVKPLKRGGGRRYYRPEDVDLLRGIRELLYTDGYTIKGVQKLLREGGVKALLNGGVPPAPVEDGAADGGPSGASPPAHDSEVGAETASPALGADKRAALREVLAELEALRDTLRA